MTRRTHIKTLPHVIKHTNDTGYMDVASAVLDYLVSRLGVRKLVQKGQGSELVVYPASRIFQRFRLNDAIQGIRGEDGE